MLDIEDQPQEIHDAEVKVANLQTQIEAIKTQMLPIKNAVEQDVYISSKLYTNDKARSTAVTAILLADEDFGSMQAELSLAEANLRLAIADLHLAQNNFDVTMLLLNRVRR